MQRTKKIPGPRPKIKATPVKEKSPAEEQKLLNQQLIYAAKIGNLKRVKELVKEGAQVDAGNKAGTTALMTAARFGNSDIVEFLIGKNADVDAANSLGRTALMMAARNGFIEIAEALLDAGADINAKDKKHGDTPLMMACLRGQVEMVEFLLENEDIEINAKNDTENSALRLTMNKLLKVPAEEKKIYKDIIKILKAKGAK